MPWYAVLKNLPAGYRNDIQQIWYVGKTYHVSSYNHDTTAVHTPNGTQKEWRISKSMARRLFDKPYYIAEGVKENATIVYPDNVPSMQPYQLQILDALYKLKKEETDSMIEHRHQITDIKRDVEKLRSGGWSYDNI